jgi:5-(carboxyamino)imidazole ribonucleotide synthase
MARSTHGGGAREPRPAGAIMRIGILGAGQLGRMLALAGYPLGYRFRFLDHSRAAAAADLGEIVVAEFSDYNGLARFADGLDVVTYEFENVPVAAAEFLAARLPVYPPPRALASAHDRAVEKGFFERLGVPTTKVATADTLDELRAGIADIGLPAVLKTRRMGYDGKGQAVVRTDAEIEAAWNTLHGVPLLAEAFVPFDRELSIIGVRGRTGETTFYPLTENEHEDGMLLVSIAPAPNVDGQLQKRAEQYLAAIMDDLDYVGVLALELFQRGDDLLANELAPRVHNSGHWTIEGAVASQFENHIRAIAGLPLGSTESIGHCAMVNLIGEMPDRAALLAIEGAHLHLYGKETRARRKLGHVTVGSLSETPTRERLARLLEIVRG